MKPITITSPTGIPLNAVLAGLLDHGIADWDSVVRIDVEEGMAGLLGDGDAPVERFVIIIDEATYTLKDHNELEVKIQELIAAHGDAHMDAAEIVMYLKNIDSDLS